MPRSTRLWHVTVVMTVLVLATASVARPQQPMAASPGATSEPGCTALGGCGAVCDPCDGYGNPSVLSAFFTADGFKGPIDLDGLNGNFGFTLGANYGATLLADWGIGAQAGASVTGADFHGSQFTGNQARTLTFTTVGVFRRPTCEEGLKAAVVYDFLFDDYYTDFEFGQWRGLIGYQFAGGNEFGVWATLRDFGDAVFLGNPRQGYALNGFESINQINVYWRHLWEGGALTELSLGTPDNHHIGNIIFAGTATCPLSDRWALLGGFLYVVPSARGGQGREEELWNVYTGIAFFFDRKARTQSCDPAAPVLPVADPGSFAITRIP